MGSSGDSGHGGQMMQGNATPQPGLPIAGSNPAAGNAENYGKFQNFLPDPAGEGPNPLAMGLRPEMLEFKSPGGGAGGALSGAGQGDVLAALKSRLGGG